VGLKDKVVRRTIPLCGIVLVLGTPGCGFTVHTPQQTTYISGASLFRSHSSQQEELIKLVQDFLKDVPANEGATFDRFFADDVIYTRGTGSLVTKKDILADTGKATIPRANATFTGEDFTVHQYGDTAIVNFRLVMQATENDKPVTRAFRNTGTFMKRNGRWQAIAWQATPIAEK
jgi:ketosteroid isomerase-like protein